MFDLAFITNELSQAENIKDKQNKKCVIRLFKMLKSRLNTIIGGGDFNNLLENGVIIFAGILLDGSEVFDIVIPPNKITEFYYECGKYFNCDRFNDLFSYKEEGYIIFIDGHNTLIYEYISGVFRLKKRLTVDLVKRHSRGGSSSGRFMRCAEISRHNYIVYVSDYLSEYLNLSIVGNNNIWLFGGNELKYDLMNYSKIKFSTSDMYHQFNLDTIKDSYFKNLMIRVDKNRVEKIDEIVYLLDTNPDKLIFTQSEISDNVEYLILIDKTLEQTLDTKIKYYNLEIGDKYYYRLKDFKLIGKLYYVNIE